jgi:hypothetical protein
MNRSKNLAAAIGLPLALAAFGTAVWAQTARLAPDAATYVCRQALPDETASAKMVVSSTSLVCRPIAVAMHMSDGSMRVIGNVSSHAIPAPDFSRALTPQQVNAAYNQWLLKALDIDPATAHTP